MTIAERARLRTLRLTSGLSYAEVARKAGITQPMVVYRILAGDVEDPRVETLRRIVEAMGGAMAEVFDPQPIDTQETER